MKKLILFRGAVETLEFFSEVMSYEFEKSGYEIIWVNLILHEESAKELVRLYDSNSNDDYYLLTFNFEGLAGEEGLYDKDSGWNFWDYAGVKVVNILVDHPLYYHKYIKNHPKRYIQIEIDSVHVDYMRRFFSYVPTTDCLLSGGTQINRNGNIFSDKRYLSMQERPIDIIFTGNYTPKSILKKNLKNMDEEYVQFYENVLKLLIENPDVTLDEMAEKCLKKEFPDITDSQLAECMPNMMYVDLAVRFHFRELIIRALADSGLVLHVYGDGYQYIKCEHPENIIQHGGVDSLKCLKMISQSKISLNVMPWFKKGSHDRVFNSMLNGSVSLTDGSEFLENEFQDGKDILFYNLRMLSDYEKSGFNPGIVRPLTENIKDILKDNTRLQAIADAAYEKCENKHSWQERAQAIIKVMDTYFN